MFKSLIKHSLRSFKRQRTYYIVNIFGLSIGIACSLLIALYIINEASYDKFNVKKDRIYRLVSNGKLGAQEFTGAFTPPSIEPTLLREFPEVEDYLRMNAGGTIVVEYKDMTFTDLHVVEADSSFFNFFSIPLLKGDPKNVLNEPGRAVLSESTAKKIFGTEDPIDKAIQIGKDTARYFISGIMSDIPEKSHFEASILTSFMTNPQSQDPSWFNNSFSTYLLLKPNSNLSMFNEKIPALVIKYVGPEAQRIMGINFEDFIAQGNKYIFFLQSIKDIHLDPSIQQQFKKASDPKILFIFGSIAILIVLVAAINFMNLSTAQASRRVKEVGIKKVGGSSRGMLIAQFLLESFLLSFISLILAFIIIGITLHLFNNLLGTNLEFRSLVDWYSIPAILLFLLVVGFLSGCYPALFLSSFNPADILKGVIRGRRQTGRLRRILVSIQFAVSILLITGTLIIYRQIFFMLNMDVGFNKEQMLVINEAHALESGVDAFKDVVKKIPGVLNISSSTAVPGRNNNLNGYGIEGRKDESFLLQTNWIDYDFIDVYGLILSEGRNFDKSFTTDRQACIINESAAKNFGLKDITSTRFIQPLDSDKLNYLQVTGIVKNFNFRSLRNPIQPYIFCFKGDNNYWGYITVKLSAMNHQQTINDIEKSWKEFTFDEPLNYYFIDEDFKQLFRPERQIASLTLIFCILAILVAALGLFGLTSFTVEQRTKEIGVRKVMGSSVNRVYFVLSREIILLVFISALIAWPLIYLIARKWLENYYYRINIDVFNFIAGLAIVLSIAILTTSFLILKAARVNPTQSLKYE